MRIVPVIDLRDGRVVHATGGRRADYAPLATPLAASSEPSAVLRGLASLYRFDCVYVADLDAIEGRGDQRAILDELLAAFPDCQFWLDAGPDSGAIAATASERLRPVLGSESHTAAGMRAVLGRRPDAVLSLDFDPTGLRGDPQLLARREDWPRDVIVMCLARVGGGTGPDLDRLERLTAADQRRNYYAAGGIRDDEDLAELERRGIAGALLATALHAGTLRGFRRTG